MREGEDSRFVSHQVSRVFLSVASIVYKNSNMSFLAAAILIAIR